MAAHLQPKARDESIDRRRKRPRSFCLQRKVYALRDEIFHVKEGTDDTLPFR